MNYRIARRDDTWLSATLYGTKAAAESDLTNTFGPYSVLTHYIVKDEGNTTPVAKKDKSGKADMTLVAGVLKVFVAAVMKFGEFKYGRWNYLASEGHELGDLISAMDRHWNALNKGEWQASDSKLPHVAHIAANCQMILEEWEAGTLGATTMRPGFTLPPFVDPWIEGIVNSKEPKKD